MLIEKEIISPGTYFYTDEASGTPRKLDVTPELTRYWHAEGSKMLGAGLTIPVPFEHDFSAHPMTPKDKLLNNSGWIKEYRLKADKLFGVLDIQDEEIAKKLPHTIRWTSPWINSFTDGNGRAWNNVISHLALTTRPRITKQAPFGSIAAALSLASSVDISTGVVPREGYCLSRAGRLVVRKCDHRLAPKYPMAFSLLAGARFAADDFGGKPDKPGKAKKGKDKKGAFPKGLDDAGNEEGDDEFTPEVPGGEGAAGGDTANGTPGEGGEGDMIDLPPFGSPAGDISMEELLCDLLQALGVPMPDESNDAEFKRHLYEAVMSKIKELTSQGMGGQQDKMNNKPDQNKPPGQNPHASQPKPGGANPLVQQEQQPMYMSLEEINKLPDPMKGVALAMYNENVKLRAELDAGKKITDSLRDAKLKEAAAQRASRVALLSRLSPRVKADLEGMLALPNMALSMGDGGAVVDPMASMLGVLEKGLGDLPRLLTTDSAALTLQPQPTDGEMSEEASDKLANDMARMMGCPPEAKKAS